MYSYIAFGILIESEIELPELIQADVTVPDVVVCFGPVASHGIEVRNAGKWFQGCEGSLRFEVEGVGRFLAERGRVITIERAEGASADDIRLFVLGSALGAVLIQRGLLALHGSSVRVSGRAIAFLGDSGVGKSTLANALNQRGVPLIADDLCMISTESGLEVQSGYPQNKLWLDSLAQLNVDPRNLRQVRPSIDKRALTISKDLFVRDACPLEKIYVLGVSESNDLRLVSLNGSEAVAGLLGCRYRPYFVERMGLLGREFEQVVQVAKSVDINLLTRSSSRFSLGEVVSLILNDLER